MIRKKTTGMSSVIRYNLFLADKQTDERINEFDFW